MYSNNEAYQVIERLKQLLSKETDQDLADCLGVSKPTISSWRQRNAVPYAICIQIAKEHGLNLDWLLLGIGEAHREEPQRKYPVSDQRAAVIVELYEALNETQQKEILAAIEEKKRVNELIEKVDQLEKKLA